MTEGNNVQKIAEGENDLYIGVRNDLSPFYVDLKALTRGLVVVGQSGCGKSFLVGRLVEELVRNTTEKTRLLIIDSNSDFCEGIRLKDEPKFEEIINTYDSGSLKKGEFDACKEIELQIFSKLKDPNILSIGQLFGRKEKYNLSWKWLVDSGRAFLKIVKADKFSIAYLRAFASLRICMKDEYVNLPEKWIHGCEELIQMQGGKKVGFEYIQYEKALGCQRWLANESFLEMMRDVGQEINSNIWRKRDDEKGLPEQLFADSRVNFVEVETIPILEKNFRLETVAFILLHCLTKRIDLIEKYRVLRIQGGGEETALKQAKPRSQTHVYID